MLPTPMLSNNLNSVVRQFSGWIHSQSLTDTEQAQRSIHGKKQLGIKPTYIVLRYMWERWYVVRV